jgi:YVTN family beta-propeller protein
MAFKFPNGLHFNPSLHPRGLAAGRKGSMTRVGSETPSPRRSQCPPRWAETARRSWGSVAVVAAVVLLLWVGTVATSPPSDPLHDRPSALQVPPPPSSTPVGPSSIVGVESSVNVGFLPTALVEDTANGWIYVANQETSNVSVVNGSTLEGTVGVGTAPVGLAYDAASGDVYVTNENSSTVTVIQGLTSIATIPVGVAPVSPVYDPADGYVYVPDFDSSSVTILNGTSVIANISVGQGPVNAVFDPTHDYVYVTSEFSWYEAIFSGAVLVESLLIHFSNAFDTVYDPYNGYVYVINSTLEGGRYGAGLGVALAAAIDGLSFLDSFAIGGGPQFGAVAAVDPINGWLYVPDAENDQVTVVNGSTVIDDVPVGGLPSNALFDPQNGFIYVSNEGALSVSVINQTSVLYQPTVGTFPEDLVYDSVSQRVYVADFGQGEVAVLGPVNGYAVTFQESGLSPGTAWSVLCYGVDKGSSTSSIVFYEPNGSIGYTVNPVHGYVITGSANGLLTLSGSGAVVPVLFQAVAPPPPPPKPFPAVPVFEGVVVALVALLVVWGVLKLRTLRRDRIGRI